MNTDNRPKCIDEYLQWDTIKKDAESRCKSLRDQVLQVLRTARFADIELRSSTKRQIDSQKAIEWAEENLTREEVRSLFDIVEPVFNPNKFVDLMKIKKISPKDLPKGTIQKVKSESIYPIKVKK